MDATAPSARAARSERRQDARLQVARPVKLRCSVSGKYLAGQTGDVSAGGALIELAAPAHLAPGQSVRVGIAWLAGQAVLRGEALADAVVVRAADEGGKQRVALRFRQRQTLSAVDEGGKRHETHPPARTPTRLAARPVS